MERAARVRPFEAVLPDVSKEGAGRGKGGRMALAGLALFVLVAVIGVLVGEGGGRWDGARAELVQQGGGDYCDGFADPAACRAFRDRAKHKYWSESRVRNELFKVMKGVAMMDEKMEAKNTAHTKALDTQQQMFTTFRSSMIREMDSLHKLQAKVGEAHTKAFKQLSSQLEEAKQQLADYTQQQLQAQGGSVKAFDVKQKANTERIIQEMKGRVADLTQKLRDLREQTSEELDSQRRLAKTVEKGLVKSDQHMLDELTQLHRESDRLDQQQQQHAEELRAKLASQAQTESSDVADSKAQADEGMASVARMVQQGLEASRNFVNQAVQHGLASLAAGVASERAAENAQWDALSKEVDSVNASETSEDTARAAEIAKLRSDFDLISAQLTAQISQIASRANTSSIQLSDDRSRLVDASEASSAFLTGRMGSGLRSLENKTDSIAEAQKAKLASIELALASIADGIKNFGDADDSAQMQWNAQKYNFEGEVHRTTQAAQDSAEKDIASQLGIETKDIDMLMGRSQQELSEVEASTEKASIAMNTTIDDALWRLEQNVSQRAQELVTVLGDYSELNASQLSTLGVSKEDAEGLVGMIDNMQDTLERLMVEDKGVVEGRTKDMIADVDFNASQTLERYKSEIRAKIADGLRDLTADSDEVQRRSVEKNDAFSEEFEAEQKQQTVINNKQLDLISKMARVAKRHATTHSLDIALAESELNSLHLDLKEFKDFMQKRHAKDMKKLAATVQSAFAKASTSLSSDVTQHGEALKQDIAAQAAKVDASISALRADVAGSARDLSNALQRATGVANRDHKELLANLTSLSAGLNGYQRTLRTGMKSLTARLQGLDEEMSRARARVGGVQQMSHEALADEVKDEVDGLAERLRSAIAGDREALLSLADGGFSSLKTAVANERDAIQRRMDEISEEQRDVARQSREDHAVHMDAVQELNWNQGNVTQRFDEYMTRIEARLQRVSDRIERGLGSDGENQRFGAWQERISRETTSMEAQYSSMLESEKDDVQRLLQATRTSLLARVATLNESMRMSHAEVNASTQDLHLSDTSQHEAATQRVDQASKYLADYSDNIDGLVAKQEADLKALGEKQRAAALGIEAQRAADYEALMSKLESGISRVHSAVESQLQDQVEAAHGEVDHDYADGTAEMEAYANASEASADAIQKDLDKLEDAHGAHTQSAGEELEVLKNAESEAELWSEQNHTEMGSQLADLKEELEMTLASLTSVQNLQFKLLASSIASSRASRSDDATKLRDDLMSRVKVVSSSVAAAKAQLAAVHTLIDKEQAQDRADVAHVLKSELASLRSNMTAELKDGSDSLRSELRARMSQLHSLVASARTRQKEAVKDMGQSVTDDNRSRAKASLAFDRKVAAIESGLNDARADEISDDKRLGERLDDSVSKLNKMLAAASKDKHILYNELEGKVTSSVVGAAGSLWDMLQKTVKGVDDEISSQLGIMGERLPKDRADFRKQLNAVRSALTVAGKSQQQHAVEQMKALHELALTIDKLEASATESLPKQKQRAAKLLADLRALEAERVAKHEEVSGSIRDMVRSELRGVSGRVGEDMMSSLEGMHSAIARNATALDQRMAAVSEAAQKERDAALQELKKFQAGLQASALQQAAAASGVHSALLQAEAVLRAEAEKLDRKFIGLSDATQKGRSESRKSLGDIKTSLHQLEAIVDQGDVLQKRYKKLGAAVDDSGSELKKGFGRAKARTEELARKLAELQQQAQYGFGNISSTIEGERGARANKTAAMSGKLDELRAKLHDQQKALDELSKEEGPRGVQGPAGAQGQEGPRGAKGPRGPPGARGMEGPAGSQGRRGPRGNRGPPGGKGADGPQGRRGKMGPVGKRGIAGGVGEKGRQGARGKRGKRGPRGSHGKHGKGFGRSGLQKLRHLAHGVVKKLKTDRAAVLLPKIGEREVARLKDRRGRYLGRSFAKRLLRTAGWKLSKKLVRRGGHWRGLHARIVKRIRSKSKSLSQELGPRLFGRLQKRQSRVVGRRLVRDLVNMIGRKKAKKLLRRGWNWRFLAKRYVKVVTPRKEKKLLAQITAPVVAELKKRQGKRLGRNLARRLQTMMTRHESKRLVQQGGRWRHLNRWVVRRLVVGSKRVKRLEQSLGKPVVAKLMKRQDKVLGTHLARMLVRTIGRQPTKRLVRRGRRWKWLNRRIVRLNTTSRRVKQLQGRMGPGLWARLQKRKGRRLGKRLAKRLTFKLGRRNVMRLTRRKTRRRRSRQGKRRTWKWLARRIVKKVHRRHEKAMIKVIGRRNVNKLKDKRGDSLGVYAKYLISKLGWSKASRLVRRGRHWRGLHSRIVRHISNRRTTKLRASIGQKLLTRLQRRRGLQMGRNLAKRIVNIIGRRSALRLVRRGWNWRYVAHRFVRRIGSKRQKLLTIALGKSTVTQLKKLRGKRMGKTLARFIVRKIGRRRAMKLVRRGGTWRHLNVWIVRKLRSGGKRAKRLESSVGKKVLRQLMARQNRPLGASLAIRMVRVLGRQPVKALLRRPQNYRYLNRRKVRRLNVKSKRVKRLRRRMGGNLWARLSKRQGMVLGKALAKRLVHRMGRYSTKKLLVRRNRPRRSRRVRRRSGGGGGRRKKGRGKWNRKIRLLSRRTVKNLTSKMARKLVGRAGSTNVQKLRRRRGQRLGRKLTVTLVKKLGWKTTKTLVWRGGMWRRLAVGIVKRVHRSKVRKLRKLLGTREFNRLKRRRGTKMGRKFAKRVERMVGWGVARTLVRRGGHWRGLPARIVRKIRKRRATKLRVLVGAHSLRQLKRRKGALLGHYMARRLVKKIGRAKTAKLVRRGWNWRWLAKRRVLRLPMKKEKRLMPSIGKSLLRRLKRRRGHHLGKRLSRRLARMLGRNTVRRIVRKGGNWRGLQKRIVRRMAETSAKMRRLRATVDKKMLDSFLARVGRPLGSRLAKSMVRVIGRKMMKTLLHWVPRRGSGWCSMWYWNPLGRREIRRMPKVAHLFPQVAKVFKQVDFRRDSAFKTVVGTRHFDRVAITFRGKLRIRKPGKYRICTNSDDGSHVSVDGKPFVSSPGLHPPRKKCRTAKLSKGDHPVFMRFFENGGGAYMRATYSGPDTRGVERNMKSSGYPGTCDAPKAKCKCGKGWCSEFFFDPNGQDQVRDFVDISHLNGQAAKTVSKIKFSNDNAIQKFLGSSSKKHGFDHVAVRFNGMLRIRKGGKYKVCTSSDDGSRLLIDKRKVVDNGGLHGTRKRCNDVTLSPGDHFTAVDFFENGGGASITVQYSGPDTGGREKLMPSVWHNPHKCGPAPP